MIKIIWEEHETDHSKSDHYNKSKAEGANQCPPRLGCRSADGQVRCEGNQETQPSTVQKAIKR